MMLFRDNRNFVFRCLIVFVFLWILIQGVDFDILNDSSNVITVTGYGEVTAVADIASISFTISKEAKTIEKAQNQVAKIEGQILTALKDNKIAEKDIKTERISFSPKYEYQYDQALIPCSEYGCPPRNGKSVIVGYTSSENIIVKVRDVDNTGVIVEVLSSFEITNLYGPNFAIDDEDELKAEARREAIKEAKEKARVLAHDLGIRLGKVSSFSEGGNGIVPYYAKAMMDSAPMEESSPQAVLPKGENTISSNVTITYTIK